MEMILSELRREHGAERSDAGTSGNKYGVSLRFAPDEGAERAAHFAQVARPQRKQIWREVALLHTIQTKLEAIAGGWTGNGISTDDELAIDHLFQRNPLSENKQEFFGLGKFKNKVTDFRCDFQRLDQPGFQTDLPDSRACLALSWSMVCRAGWPSRGGAVRISMPGCVCESPWTIRGRSRWRWSPRVRK